MNFLSNPIAARLLWALPLLMAVISVGLLRAGLEQRETAESGQTVVAEVVDLEVRERSEITRGAVTLRYTPPGEAEPVVRPVELPLAFLKDIEAEYKADSALTVPIQVREGRDQVVLGAYPRAQWVLTFSFAGMALIGALGLTWLVAGWNRFLARDGDPALRDPATA